MKYVQGYKGETLPGPVRGGMPVKGPRTIGMGGGMPNPVRDIGTGGGGIAGPINPRALLSGRGMKKGGSVSSASKRADGCAVKGKTKGKMV